MNRPNKSYSKPAGRQVHAAGEKTPYHELPRQVELNDPRALRALAHPVRLKLVGLLRREGPLTATQAGELIDESPASCSFHFRQLARWNLVEEAGGGKGRERPWRATARFTSWHIDRPDLAEPAAAVSSLIVQSQFEKMSDAIVRLSQEPREWQHAHQLSDFALQLTAPELETLAAKLFDVIHPYERLKQREGSRSVTLFISAFPAAEEDRT